MKSKLLQEDDGQRTFVLVFESGDSVMDLLKRFAGKEKLAGAQFTAIGAFSAVTLGYFDWEKKDYIGRDFPNRPRWLPSPAMWRWDPRGHPRSVSIACSADRTTAPWPAIS